MRTSMSSASPSTRDALDVEAARLGRPRHARPEALAAAPRASGSDGGAGRQRHRRRWRRSECRPRCRRRSAPATRSVTGWSGVDRRDDERKHHLVAIDERDARAVVVALRRRIEHLDVGDVLRAGEIEDRRHAGLAGIAPIGVPAGLEQRSRCRRRCRPSSAAASSSRICDWSAGDQSERAASAAAGTAEAERGASERRLRSWLRAIDTGSRTRGRRKSFRSRRRGSAPIQRADGLIAFAHGKALATGRLSRRPAPDRHAEHGATSGSPARSSISARIPPTAPWASSSTSWRAR